MAKFEKGRFRLMWFQQSRAFSQFRDMFDSYFVENVGIFFDYHNDHLLNTVEKKAYGGKEEAILPQTYE